MDQTDSPSIQERPSAGLLNWPGKADAIAEANSQPAHRLSASDSRRLTDANQSNIFVQGDNLDTMKVLESTHGSQFKLGYMDPPYNTGQSLLYHDATSFQKWLSMMYPRLVVARRLLANDGLICLSIGDLALAHLRLLADEVFGSDIYINTVAVRTKLAAGVSGGGEDKRLKKILNTSSSTPVILVLLPG